MRAVLNAALAVFSLTAGAFPGCGKLSWRPNLAALRATASGAETNQWDSMDVAESSAHGASRESRFKRFSSRAHARRQISKVNSSDLALGDCFWKRLKKWRLVQILHTRAFWGSGGIISRIQSRGAGPTRQPLPARSGFSRPATARRGSRLP